MHILVTYGTKMGGTKEIAKRISETFKNEHFSVTLREAKDMEHPEEFDAVVLGSAIYALRWRRDAIRVMKQMKYPEPGLRCLLFGWAYMKLRKKSICYLRMQRMIFWQMDNHTRN